MVHLCLSKMVHLGLSEVETAGNLGSLWQGQVLGALEPGRGEILGHGYTNSCRNLSKNRITK